MNLKHDLLHTAAPLVASLLTALVLLSCGHGLPLSDEEQAYLERVEGVRLPLRMEPRMLDTVVARAARWIELYSVYPVRTRGSNFIRTDMPRSLVQGGVGYNVEANRLDDVLTVDVEALRIDRFEGTRLESDPVIEKMLGLYLRDGVLPPNDHVGFDDTRR